MLYKLIEFLRFWDSSVSDDMVRQEIAKLSTKEDIKAFESNIIEHINKKFEEI